MRPKRNQAPGNAFKDVHLEVTTPDLFFFAVDVKGNFFVYTKGMDGSKGSLKVHHLLLK
ncbi:hypothetical protein [Corallococcus sp. CA053C]|uniref:hypothetical protein n=1 Tax=Corallococcus sp. CA053C TaxID=2316732 RepID=UPI001315931D|nr:hypothetical protein [Corallococcus sp. CA053C]